MSASDARSLIAFHDAITEFCLAAKDGTAADEDQRAPLLKKLKDCRQAAVVAGVRFGASFDEMTRIGTEVIGSCISHQRWQQDNDIEWAHVKLAGEVVQSLQKLSDLAKLAESLNDRRENEKNQLPPDAKPLSQTQIEILQAMLKSKAIDSARRKTTEQIAIAAQGPHANPESLKRPIANLRKRGLIETQDGAGGGCWLSDSGLAWLEQLKKTRSKGQETVT
jgi:hypothetical protein